MCEVAKDVQDILQTTHEETQTIKNSRLQMLTTIFEEVRMKENETFDDFYASLNDTVNSRFNLSERNCEKDLGALKSKSICIFN